MDAEIKAVDQLILELIYPMDLLNFLEIENQTPISIYCDNKNAVDLCNTIKQSHKTKVINMRVHFIRDMIKGGLLQSNLSDLYTMLRMFLQNLSRRIYMRC